MIDCKCTNKSADNVAVALNHSLKMIFMNIVEVISYG